MLSGFAFEANPDLVGQEFDCLCPAEFGRFTPTDALY